MASNGLAGKGNTSNVRGTPLHLKIREGHSDDFASFVTFLISFEYEIPHNNQVCRLLFFFEAYNFGP